MKNKFILPFVAAAFLALAVSPVLAAVSPSVAPTSAVATIAGLTSVKLDQKLMPTLQSLGITLSPLSPTTLYFSGAGVASFPIVSGVFDPVETATELSHTGGLVFTAGSTQLVVSSFVIEVLPPSPTATPVQGPVLTALATLNGKYLGRIPLFDIGLGNAKITFPYGRLNITNVSLTLDSYAASALNSIFSKTAFAGGLAIGQAQVSAFILPLPKGY